MKSVCSYRFLSFVSKQELTILLTMIGLFWASSAVTSGQLIYVKYLKENNSSKNVHIIIFGKGDRKSNDIIIWQPYFILNTLYKLTNLIHVCLLEGTIITILQIKKQREREFSNLSNITKHLVAELGSKSRWAGFWILSFPIIICHLFEYLIHRESAKKNEIKYISSSSWSLAGISHSIWHTHTYTHITYTKYLQNNRAIIRISQ